MSKYHGLHQDAKSTMMELERMHAQIDDDVTTSEKYHLSVAIMSVRCFMELAQLKMRHEKLPTVEDIQNIYAGGATVEFMPEGCEPFDPERAKVEWVSDETGLKWLYVESQGVRFHKFRLETHDAGDGHWFDSQGKHYGAITRLYCIRKQGGA